MPGKGRPFTKDKPGPGRPKGSVNKAKLAFNALLKDIAESEEYQVSLRARAINGDPTLDKEILARVLGSIPKVMQIDVPKPLVIDLVTGPDASDSE